MLNNVNVVGDIGSGSYEVNWNNRFVESEIFNSYSHPLPIIGTFTLFRKLRSLLEFYRWKVTNKKHELLFLQKCNSPKSYKYIIFR